MTDTMTAIESLHSEAAAAGMIEIVVLCEEALDGCPAARARLVGASEQEQMTAEIEAAFGRH